MNTENLRNDFSSSTATIMHQGYIIELADGGPWLRHDLTWTPDFEKRGVWLTYQDAQLAIARSLSPNGQGQRRAPETGVAGKEIK